MDNPFGLTFLINALTDLGASFDEDEDGLSAVTVQLRSSWLSGATWSPRDGTLELETANGDSLTHFGVDFETFLGLAQAKSPGQYWHQKLK